MMILRAINPFASLPNSKAVWAWGMYDFANQSFTLIINTLLFSIFFKEVVVGGGQAANHAAAASRGDSLWSITFSISMAVVVLLSPIVGALADARGWRKAFLIGTGLVCVVLTCSFALLRPHMVVLAMLLYIPANIAYQIGENFLASFLPSVSTPRNIGRVSAIGWTMGYVGALLLLLCVAVGMKVLHLARAQDWGVFFVFAGVWFLGGMVPTMVVLHEPPVAVASGPRRSVVAMAFERLKQTWVSAQAFAQLRRFFLAFFVYGMGVQVIIVFASILARDFGFDTTRLVLFILQLTVTAGIAAIGTARFQDRIGARTTVLIFLGVWILSTLGLLAISMIHPHPQWAFWLVGNGIGLGIGGIGTASRSLVGRFTPVHKTAEFFGLWGMVYKSAGVIGVLAFGQVKAWVGMPASLGLLLVFFVVGLVLMLRVNEQRGLRAAMRAQRQVALRAVP